MGKDMKKISAVKLLSVAGTKASERAKIADYSRSARSRRCTFGPIRLAGSHDQPCEDAAEAGDTNPGVAGCGVANFVTGKTCTRSSPLRCDKDHSNH